MCSLATVLARVPTGRLPAIVVLAVTIPLLVPQCLYAQGVSGPIATNTTWSGSVLVDGDVVVQCGVVLTVEPGTNVVFTAGSSTYDDSLGVAGLADLIVLGGLLSNGIEGGGVSYGSNAAYPSPGDWGGIHVLPVATDTLCRLTHTSVSHAYVGLKVAGEQITIENSGFSQNASHGIQWSDATLPVALCGLTFNQNGSNGLNFSDCDSLWIFDCEFDGNAATGIHVDGCARSEVSGCTIEGSLTSVGVISSSMADGLRMSGCSASGSVEISGRGVVEIHDNSLLGSISAGTEADADTLHVSIKRNGVAGDVQLAVHYSQGHVLGTVYGNQMGQFAARVWGPGGEDHRAYATVVLDSNSISGPYDNAIDTTVGNYEWPGTHKKGTLWLTMTRNVIGGFTNGILAASGKYQNGTTYLDTGGNNIDGCGTGIRLHDGAVYLTSDVDTISSCVTGLHLHASGFEASGAVSATLRGSIITGCETGVFAEEGDPPATVAVDSCSIANSGGTGIDLDEGWLVLTGSEVIGSGDKGLELDGVSLVMTGSEISASGSHGLVLTDLVSCQIGGSLEDANDIHGNAGRNILASGDSTVPAKYNYWGTVNEDTLVSRLSGPIDYEPWTDATHTQVCTTSYLSGVLAAGAVWDGVVKVAGDIYVPPGAGLTIEPGTEVKIYANASRWDTLGVTPNRCDIIVDGAISVGGETGRADSVSFVSWLPLQSLTPQGGQWGKILLSGGPGDSAAVFSGARFDGATVSVSSESTPLRVVGCSFGVSSDDALQVEGEVDLEVEGTSSLGEIVISGRGSAMFDANPSLTDVTVTASAAQETLSVEARSTVVAGLLLLESRQDDAWLLGSVTGSTLNSAELFARSSTAGDTARLFAVVDSNLIADGTSGLTAHASAYVSGLSYLGDVEAEVRYNEFENCGTATEVYRASDGVAYVGELDLVFEHNSMSGCTTGLHLTGADSMRIRQNELSGDQDGEGIRCTASSPTIRDNYIDSFLTAIHCESEADPTVENNSLSCAACWGVNNTSASTVVDATDNWWGCGTGPNHPVSNPSGLGSPVSDNVVYDPWLTDYPNRLPMPFSLLSPQPGALADTTIVFDWEDAFDPDCHDVILYRLEVGADSLFRAALVVDSLAVSECMLPLELLTIGDEYLWRVGASDGQATTWSTQQDWTFLSAATGVDDEVDGVPATYVLRGISPNPFNPRTTVSYGAPTESRVRLAVYNVAGRLVRTLVDGEVSPGYHSVVWDGRDEKGAEVGSGVYFCLMEAEKSNAASKMVLLK